MWLPFAHIASIEISASEDAAGPALDSRGGATGPAFKGKELGEVLLPVLAPFSCQHADETVRWAATVWDEEDGEAVPFGQKMLLVDGEEFRLLDVWRSSSAAVEDPPTPCLSPVICSIPFPATSPAARTLLFARSTTRSEARREEDDVPQGDWRREAQDSRLAAGHQADHRDAFHQEQRPATGGVADRGHAAARRHQRLARGLDLLAACSRTSGTPSTRNWKTATRSCGPLRCNGSDAAGQAVKHVPLTRSGLDWFQYKESRTVRRKRTPRRARQASARETAIAEGKIPPEEFDADFDATPRSSTPVFRPRSTGCWNRSKLWGRSATRSSATLRPASARCGHVSRSAADGAHPAAAQARDAPEAARRRRAGGRSARIRGSLPYAGAGRAGRRLRRRRGRLSAEPVDRDDACRASWHPWRDICARKTRTVRRRTCCCADCAGANCAPRRDPRRDHAGAAAHRSPAEAEDGWRSKAMGGSAGDCRNRHGAAMRPRLAGPAALRVPRVRGTGQLLRPHRDGDAVRTAGAADGSTRSSGPDHDGRHADREHRDAGLDRGSARGPSRPATAAGRRPPRAEHADHESRRAGSPPDTYELAMEACASGRPQEGIEMLMRELGQERSGRGRFHRKVQLAQLCMASGHEDIALPILEELAAEIERRKLEDWEAPDMVAHPLALLYRCLEQAATATPEEKQRLYAWICRLDPLQALNVSR